MVQTKTTDHQELEASWVFSSVFKTGNTILQNVCTSQLLLLLMRTQVRERLW